jgi:hypothetical protein
MGNLKPGATYIYERVDGVVYAREAGADPVSREAVGWDADAYPDSMAFNVLKESNYWRDILTAAKTNPTLQEALDRAKIIYELSKKDGNEKS